MKLFLDLETYSDVPIRHGTHAYAENAGRLAEILLFAYAIDEGEIKVLDFTAGELATEELIGALQNSSAEIIAHNSHFDRTVMSNRMHNYTPPVEQWRDTMVRALSHSLPGALDKLCDIFNVGVDKAKDKRGKQLIHMFCVPQAKNRKLRRLTRETNPKEWAEFIEYARLDIAAMRELDKLLPSFNYNNKVGDLQQWFLDQKINDRGFCSDVELASAALRQVERTQKSLRKKTSDLTFGEVSSPLKRDKLLKYILATYDIELEDMKATTLERVLKCTDLPWALREIIAARLQASTSSTSKYKALLRSVSRDGRLRNSLKFCGASRTGRWSGQLFQPQNLARPDKDMTPEKIEEGITALKNDCADFLIDDPMRLMSNACRGAITAPPGKKLVVSDLANIEGRAQAWLADETWKLDAFRAFDAGKGHDMYAMAYAKSFGVTPESVMEDKKAGGNQRQIGKVQELALGYEGGVGAFITFSLAYNVDLDSMAEQVVPRLPPEIYRQAEKAHTWAIKKGRAYELDKQTYMACDALKRMWRDAHPHIVNFWIELDELVRRAIEIPEHVFVTTNGKIRIVRNKNWLRIILPSGRSLCYPSPQIDNGKITYWGVNQFTRKWQRIQTYGGKIFENICQAFARDVMAANMGIIEAAGYWLVLTVHDEDITEAPDEPRYSAKHLAKLMCTPIKWAPDMPLAAGGFESKRYRKEA